MTQTKEQLNQLIVLNFDVFRMGATDLSWTHILKHCHVVL